MQHISTPPPHCMHAPPTTPSNRLPAMTYSSQHLNVIYFIYYHKIIRFLLLNCSQHYTVFQCVIFAIIVFLYCRAQSLSPGRWHVNVCFMSVLDIINFWKSWPWFPLSIIMITYSYWNVYMCLVGVIIMVITDIQHWSHSKRPKKCVKVAEAQ